jgi:dGTPase
MGKLDFDESTKLYLWYSLIRDIIDYFIKDVTLNSSNNLLKIENKELYDDSKNKISVKYKKSLNSNYEQKYFDSKIIDFSMSGKEFDKKLEEYIQNQILNSYNVNRFDGKAIYIVRQLFKAYYTNPRQMPSTTLDKLSERLQENSEKYWSELILIDTSIDEVNFRTGRPEDIAELIKLLKLELNQKELENIFNLNCSHSHRLKLDINFLKSIGGDLSLFNPNCEECDENYNKKILFHIFRKVNNMKLESINSKNNEKRAKLLFIKCILEHHYVYLSLICDHIAGMTDNYANSEYEKLYLV